LKQKENFTSYHLCAEKSDSVILLTLTALT